MSFAIREAAVSVFRSGVTALVDYTATVNSKVIGGIIEKKDESAGTVASKVAHDEGLEPFWETLFCSILTKLSDVVTPKVPHQIVIIPGKLLGSLWHWLSTDYRSLNAQAQNGNGKKKEKNLLGKFYDNFIEEPTNFYQKMCGLNDENSSFIRYGISQAGIFGLTSYLLKNTEEELPGVDIDPDEGKLISLYKGLGYTLVEQATYAVSQITRYCINFNEEFSKDPGKQFDKNVLAKAIANVVNERFFPGHLLAGISASVSTYLLGNKMPKITAAALGEFPAMFLNRVMNCHKRRATKYQIGHQLDSKGHITDSWYWLDQNGQKIKNYRMSNSSGFTGLLDLGDRIFEGPRKWMIKLVSSIFNISEQEIHDSFEIKLKGKRLPAQIVQSSASQASTPIVPQTGCGPALPAVAKI